ncbi:MAG: LLM class flavin-dependent oxidoreductase [Candidatus Heimdallarchaeaceae archaeon]
MTTFGVQIEPQMGYNWKEIYDIVQAAEKNNFTHTWFSDHFLLRADSVDQNCYECIAAMMGAAAKTEKLRIGPLVLCNLYRYPAVLAKQIATLDHFSNGRIEFGFGTGWKEVEFNQYGIEFPSGGVRLAMFEEALQIIKSLWTEERTTFEGKYYKIKDAVAAPKPLQKPHPTIWIGVGSGKDKILNLTAKYGEGVNFAWAVPVEELERKFDKLDSMMVEHGRDPKIMKKSYGAWSQIYKDEEEKKKHLKETAEHQKISVEELETRLVNVLHGTPNEIVGKIKDYKKIGVDHFIMFFPQNEEVEQIEIFAEEVMPKI